MATRSTICLVLKKEDIGKFMKFDINKIPKGLGYDRNEKVEEFYKSTTILNWWNAMEQRSIELSLEYRYMCVTDITNWYGSINPQSIEWALLCKNTDYDARSVCLPAALPT